MQANCPKCSNRIVVDDAKVPDRPFNVKCPKCQAIVRFPGKAAAAPAAAPPAAAPPAPPAPPPAAAGQEPSFEPPPMPPVGAREEGEAGHALVALADRNLTGAMTVALSRAGYNVQSPDDPAEGLLLLDQGFDLVVTARTGVGEDQDGLYQRIARLAADARRRIFLVLVGDEFRTGDGTQAWSVLADLVMKPADVPAADRYIRAIVAERRRIYQAFDEAWKRVEEAKAARV